MKKRFLSIITALALCLSLLPTAALAAGPDVWDGTTEAPSGSGTSDSPYLISTAEELAWLATRSAEGSYYVKLTADIILNDGTFDQSGNFTKTGDSTTSTPHAWTPAKKAVWHIDGDGHYISGMYINSKDNDDVGLFSNLKGGSYVRNLTIKNSYVTASQSDKFFGVGVFAGQSSSDFTNCAGENNIVSASRYATGGIVGFSNRGSFNGVHTSGSISGGKGLGGLVGWVFGDTVFKNCWNEASVSGGNFSGGIVGSGGNYSDCYNCANLGSGGITGSTGRTIKNCYNLSEVENYDSAEQLKDTLNDNLYGMDGMSGLNKWVMGTDGYPLPTGELFVDTTVYYDVWLNGVRVGERNQDDILKNGLASYNKDTKTLYLHHGLVVTNPYNKSLLYTEGNINLCVDGSVEFRSAQKVGSGPIVIDLGRVGGSGDLKIYAPTGKSAAVTVTCEQAEYGIDVSSLTLDGDVSLTVRTRDTPCFANCDTITLLSSEAVLDAENLDPNGQSMLNFVSSVNLPSTNPQKLYEGTGDELECVEQFTTEDDNGYDHMYPHIRIAPEVYGLSDTLPKSLTVSMTEANTQAALSTWAARQIRTGDITASNSEITVSDVIPAVAGSYTNQSGTDGSFKVKVTLTQNGISKTTTIPGTITATAYVAPTIASGIRVGTLNESGVFVEKANKTFTCGDPIVFAVSYTANGTPVTSLAGTVACFDETKALTWSAANNCYLAPAFTYPKAGGYTASYTIGEGGEYSQQTGTLPGLMVEGMTLQASDFTFTAPANLIYDGNTKTATVSFSGSPTCNGTVTVKYYLDGALVTEAKEAGTYTVKIDVTASDYYKAATDLTDSSWTFTIVYPTATAGTAPTANDLTYNGQPQALVTAGSSTSGTLLYSTTENGTYTETVPTGTNAGNYTVYWYVKGDSTHSDSAKQSVPIEIKAKNLSSDDVTIGSIADQTYNGSALTPAVVMKDGEQTLAKDTDYTVAYESNQTAGTAAVKITGTGNYTGERSATFTVVPKPLTLLDFSGITVTKVYDGTTDAGTLSGTVGFEGKCGSDNISIAAKPGPYAEGAADVGTGKSVTLTLGLAGSAADNYALTTNTYTFTAAAITKADGSVTAPVGTTGLVYSGTAQALLTAGAASTTGEVQYSLDGTNYGTELPTAINAGTYTVYCKSVGDSNHFDAQAASIQVTIAQKTITITAKDKSVYVGVEAPDLSDPVLDKDYTVSGLMGEDQLIQAPTLTYDPAAPDTAKAGNAAAIRADGANAGSNYQIVYVDGVLKVTTRPSSASDSHPISTAGSDHGAVTVNPRSAEKGDTVTITVKPDKGYTLETLTVTDKNGNKIELTNKGDGKYTFKMPGSKVTVKATFMEDNSMLNFFVDVPADAYYYDAVLWAAESGITGGVDDTHFAPNAPCTRAQIVTFLWRAAGCPEPENVSSFADVSADAYYAKAVAWAVENGITTGTGDGTTFSPNATCTRAQAMTFIYRSEQAQGGGMQGAWMFQNPFSDVDLENYYGEAVMWAVANGVTGGTTATTFSPNNDCTRAQIVTFLYRFFVK